MSDRFPYNLPSRKALCVEIRKISKYREIEDTLVTFEDIYFSPTSSIPGRTFIEMVDLKAGIKSWFTYRRLDLKRAIGENQRITMVGRISHRTIVEEINRSRHMTFMEDDVDMSDDLIDNASGEFTYTLKALTGSYAYYGKVDITVSSSGIPENTRRLENDTPRLLENGEFRSMD